MVGTYAFQLVAEQCGGQVAGYFQTPKGPTLLSSLAHMILSTFWRWLPQKLLLKIPLAMLPFHFFAIDFLFRHFLIIQSLSR
jgi:hypothetical protein